MHTGTNLFYTKQYNLRIVHEVVRLFGPLSRGEIAQRTDLTKQTVYNLVSELQAAGLVVEAERRQDVRGAPTTTFALNPDGAFAVGLDLDRDHLTGVLVDLTGRVRQRVRVDLDTPTPEQTVALAEETVRRLVAEQGLELGAVWGVGLCIPGPMYRTPDGQSYLATPYAFGAWDAVPLDRLLQERLELPVFLENNGTAAAMGERWYGAGKHINTFFYIYLGIGLGGGLIMNGEPYEGCTGNAGEIGYSPTVLAGEAAGEETPHLGMYFNVPRLLESLRRHGEAAHTLDDLDRLFAEGHPRVLAWAESAADHLAGVVLGVECLLDPDAIFFGGRVPEALLRWLVERVEQVVPARRMGRRARPPMHMVATAGVDAAALGVATLPLYRFFSPAPGVLLKKDRRQQTRFDGNPIIPAARGPRLTRV